MSLATAEVEKIVKTYQRSKSDTGSSEVQVALLSARITYLTEHLKKNPHDKHTGYGLDRLVSQRRKLLRYLKNTSLKTYKELIEKLGLRG